MKKKKMTVPLSGIIPPMVTPLLEEDKLDYAGLEKLIEHLISGGVHGIFLLGSTGEAPSLSYRLRMELIKESCKLVNGRVPVLVGITDTSFVESVNICSHSAESGADAVVLAPPYYFPAGQEELFEYIDHIVPKLKLPVFLYNMPGYTKLYFEPETVRRASELPNVLGLKDSSGNMIYFHQLQFLFKDSPDFSLLVGPEELLGESVLLGGHGGVCGGANFCPELYVNLYNAAKSRDIEKVAELHRKVIQIRSTIYSVGKYGSSFLKGVKCALSCMGICNDFVAEPFHSFRAKEREIIRQHMVDLGLLGK